MTAIVEKVGSAQLFLPVRSPLSVNYDALRGKTGIISCSFSVAFSSSHFVTAQAWWMFCG